MHYRNVAEQECAEFFLIVGSTENACELYLESLESLNFELLELVGIGYVIEHYISFFHKRQKSEAYNIYVTDVLKMILENTAMAVRGGKYIKLRYADIVEPQKEEERTAEEIISHIKDKLAKVGE